MPPIHTLRDLDLLEGSSALSSKGGGRSDGGPSPTIHHIPDLPESDATLAMLRRIHREFDPIIQRRGYRVLSISEMCCCADGLDFDKLPDVSNNDNVTLATTTGGKKKKRPTTRRKRRKRRIMASNILGYNQSRGRVHTIHLRMREAQNHRRLFCYEDIAGTMAHELAHCEHSAHNAKFYKLMDEILEQHAVLLARGFVADKDGFPMNSAQSYVLGSATNKSANGKKLPTAAAAAARAADERKNRSRWMPQGPQVLGGDDEFRKMLRPGEAAGMAAELRRLRDEKWCLPCQTDNNNSDDDEEEEQDDDANSDYEQGNDKKPRALDREPGSKQNLTTAEAATNHATQRVNLAATGPLVDLTEMDSDDDGAIIITEASDQKLPADESIWSCSQCTFRNQFPALACGMCQGPRLPVDHSEETARELLEADSEELARALLAADEAQRLQEEEVRRSQEVFGFNIYGTAEKKTNTMHHLT